MTVQIHGLRTIPITQLRPHPRNIRQDLGDLDELAISMHAQGQLQPLLVAPKAEGERTVFVVIDGHRRLAAARQSGIRHLACLLTREGQAEHTTAAMLAASLHRQLTPLEQANAFRRLVKEHGLTPKQIAVRTGYSDTTVRDRLAMADLPPEVQRRVQEGSLTTKNATDLGRQIRRRGAGSTRMATRRTAHLTSSHHLAEVVANACDHRDSRVFIGKVGCGQCWEHAIRSDATAGASS